MPGLDPGIQLAATLDCRVGPGNDDEETEGRRILCAMNGAFPTPP
jgi:hypothetical protein